MCKIEGNARSGPLVVVTINCCWSLCGQWRDAMARQDDRARAAADGQAVLANAKLYEVSKCAGLLIKYPLAWPCVARFDLVGC